MKTKKIFKALFKSLCYFGLFHYSILMAGTNDWIYLSSKDDIQQSDPLSTHVEVDALPLEDYPLLDRFRNISEIRLETGEGSFATDEKLKAVVVLKFSKLRCVVVDNGRLITDSGIATLTAIDSLNDLGLEGTAITDASLEMMASKMKLTDLSVCNCSNVTFTGLKKMFSSEILQEVSFSVGTMTQDQIFDLLDSFKNVIWCEIDDPQKLLDKKALEAKVSAKNITLLTRGADIQDISEIKIAKIDSDQTAPLPVEKPQPDTNTAKIYSPETDMGKLQGTWQLLYQQSCGMKLPDEKTAKMFQGKMVFSRNKIHYTVMLPGFDFTINYKIDPTRQPKTIDLEFINPEDNFVQDRCLGIYSLETNTLKICYNQPNRPIDFNAEQGSSNVLITLER